MHINSYEEVKKITESLVQIPSVVNKLGEETNCARYIYDYYMELDYFKRHPDRVKMVKTVDDSINRHSTYAFVKGTKGNSNKTVILISHIDTVGIDDFGSMKEKAYNFNELPELLMQLDIDDEVKEDVLSKEYMFGRGSLDMKSGVATHMFLIKYLSEHTDEIDGNIVAYAACDEEEGSHGILTGLKEFKKLKIKEGFEYIACINSDYSTGYDKNDTNRYIYFGSIGKLLPSYYVIGKETHVGQAYSGLDPNLITSELTRLIDLNSDLCDKAYGEVSSPPISLKQSDLKPQYTVQTAFSAYACYNFLTMSLSPEEVLEIFRKKAVEAFNNVINYLNESYIKYCDICNKQYSRLPWESRVYTWEELYGKLKQKHGEKFSEKLSDFANRLNKDDPQMDLRIFSIKVIEEAWKWMDDKSPAVILFFGSAYVPRVEVTGKTENEIKLYNVIQKAVNIIANECRNPIVIRNYFPYISDSSYMALSDNVSSVEKLGRNMPSWESKYIYNVNDILEINVPVVNVGVHGKDGHKFTERVHMDYSFNHVPNITYEALIQLLS